MKNVAILTAAFALAGCSLFGGGTDSTPVLGERQSVLGTELEISVDPATAAIPLTLPAAQVNSEWSQPGGNASKSMGHLAFNAADGLNPAWTASIGEGNSRAARLISAPVVAEGRVYTIDTQSTVRAFDLNSGATIWSARVSDDRGDRSSLFGGGVAYDAGRIYATNGLGQVAAIDAATGAIVWTMKPAGPLRGSPSVQGDTIYVITQDNQIFALDKATGERRWNQNATLEIAGVFGSSAPAIARGTVVAGFSSGELNAYRYENGRVVWSDTLSRTSISRSVSSISDIDAEPVIDGAQVFAIGNGGRMVSLDLLTGQRQWELNIAGANTPWVAGDWVFVLTDDAKVIAVKRDTGRVKWLAELPEYRSPKNRKGRIRYTGPVLAGDRLIVAGFNGMLYSLNPVDGSIVTQQDMGHGTGLSPVVANNTLLILDGRGRLHAFR
ncbi:MAG: PQQ-binding-like beta-propeller repeat protein [Sphingomonas sp.]|nr:PQQ-binding-like beta-propeller repeat protein [Sphingomonas sp.]